MPVHAFGRAADMDGVMAVAKRHNLFVVEDAACSIGSAWKGRQTGGIGHVGCLSFHPRKVITTGEGGMVTTDDDALAQSMRTLRNHGGVRIDGRFVFQEAGFNYWMSDLQAAVGVAQMRKLDTMNARRRGLAEALSRMLEGAPGVATPSAGGPGEHIFQSFIVLLEASVPRDAVIHTLRQIGVESTLGTYALHCQPYYQRAWGYRPGDLPNSRQAYERTLALPLYHEMEHADLVRVAASLRAAVAEAAKPLARAA
jgi:dTDP-4-amino-4,6-dideoxygalactose transaminase